MQSGALLTGRSQNASAASCFNPLFSHRTGGRQRTHPVFTQRERGCVATSLPLIWSLPLRHSNGTAPPAGSMVSVEGSNAWDLHPMVPAWPLGADPSAGSLLPLRSQFSVLSLLNHLVDTCDGSLVPANRWSCSGCGSNHLWEYTSEPKLRTSPHRWPAAHPTCFHPRREIQQLEESVIGAR